MGCKSINMWPFHLSTFRIVNGWQGYA